jgi:hypothetical protein
MFSDLPPQDGRLLQNFALQTARAFERTYQFESEKHPQGTLTSSSAGK